MIHYISGRLIMKMEDRVVIETGGVGYEVLIPGNSRLYMAEQGTEAEVYTHMQVTQDDLILYGFGDEKSLRLFKALIRVNSVGAKAALAILSVMPPEDVRRAIVYEDVQRLTSAKGVGKKTAQKIVLELKDKLGKPEMGVTGGFPEGREPAESFSGDDNRAIAVEGLINLGFSRSEAMANLIGIEDDDLTVEEYIKIVLKRI